mgnify:CR=1 FL=1
MIISASTRKYFNAHENLNQLPRFRHRETLTMMRRYNLRSIRFASYMNNIRANIDISFIIIERNVNILIHKIVACLVDIVVLFTIIIDVHVQMKLKLQHSVRISTTNEVEVLTFNRVLLSTTCSTHSTQY